MRFETSVIFGGTGFVGTQFAAHLVRERLAGVIWLVDRVPPDETRCPPVLIEALRAGQVRVLDADVRRPIPGAGLPSRCDLVVNLAAVHREPGHVPREYWETNLLGAEHVCAWAEAVGCPQMIFTSSIAPYGPTEEARDESALPVPATAYGGSKLAAEKIHVAWQRAESARRRLVIARPGVIFGPGEGGNVTRLVGAVLKRFFFYSGNRDTRKAGGYIKELCHTLTWALERQQSGDEPLILYNFSMDPAPTVEEYVEAICRVARVRRRIPRVPYAMLYTGAIAIETLARPLGIDHPFSPVRIRKLVRSNNIVPGYLRAQNYGYRYTLESAFEDWKAERPSDWSGGRSGTATRLGEQDPPGGQPLAGVPVENQDHGQG